VAAGDVLLAVGRPAGWEPVTGPLTEVRTREHGIHPLPEPPAPGEPLSDSTVSTAKEHRDECP
jgi:hypothetical protein